MQENHFLNASVSEAVHLASTQFAARGVPSAYLTAEVLLAHVLRVEKTFLYTYPEKYLSAEQTNLLRQLVEERCQGTPTQYLTGVQEFFGLDFEVTPDVLIPRPETELLVECTLNTADRGDRILDIGTGSGCVAISIKKHQPTVSVGACDLSLAALGIASKNANQLGVIVNFFVSDLASAIQEKSLDIIVANPPYVPLASLPGLQRELRAEPSMALFGGQDGLEHYQRLIPKAATVLRTGGYLLLELGHQNRMAIEAMLLANQWKRLEIKKDLAGFERVLIAQKN